MRIINVKDALDELQGFFVLAKLYEAKRDAKYQVDWVELHVSFNHLEQFLEFLRVYFICRKF